SPASARSIAATISKGSAIRPAPTSPQARSPAPGPTRSTPRASSVAILARVAGCAHIIRFIAGAISTGLSEANSAVVARSSANPRRHAGDQIGARRGGDDEIGLAREADMPHLALVGQRPEIVVDLVLAQRGDRQRRHEMLRRRGHDATHRGTALAQPADQLE